MKERIILTEAPQSKELYMIAGWRQWADAGAISSMLPKYLADLLGARKIGEISDDGFYIFQIPGTHHLMRPVIKMNEGRRASLDRPVNEIYFAGDEDKGVLIFLGDEPHMNVDRYSDTFFDVVKMFGVQRVAIVAGVYGSMPYNRDREIGCMYSLQSMKEELDQYAVRYSNYHGGSSIGTYLLDQATRDDIEYFGFYGMSPAYEFPAEGETPHGIRIETDYKAWYDITLRLDHMFKLGADLSELEQESKDLLEAFEQQVEDLERDTPGLDLKTYLDSIDAEFTERSFIPLDDVWSSGLEDLFD
ncbi:MAG: PAC2 family protein [Chloroflexota bacterium]